MNKFKKIAYSLIILLIPLMLIAVSYTFYNTQFANFSAGIKASFEMNISAPTNFACSQNNQENIKKIADDYSLDYYQGDIVKDEISKYFSDPRIPKGYQFTKEDLQESYALANDNNPIIVYLKFEDKAKFEKISQFYGYGQVFVNYSKREDTNNNEIFLGDTSEHLSTFINQFLAQRCY